MSNIITGTKLLSHKTYRNDRCFICGSANHYAKFCPNKITQIPKCDKCNNIGHNNKDCLLKPGEITESLLNEKKMCCFVCKSSKHLVCNNDNNYMIEGYNSDEVELSSDEEENKKEKIEKPKQSFKKKLRVFLTIPNEFISETKFCYKCGGMHSSEKCILGTLGKKNSSEMERKKFQKISENYTPFSLKKLQSSDKIFNKIKLSKENIFNRII